MKLKYYLRGLGIGIVVSSLLMGYSGNSRALEKQDSTNLEKQEDIESARTLKDLEQAAKENAIESSEEVIEVSEPENNSNIEKKRDTISVHVVNDDEMSNESEKEKETIQEPETIPEIVTPDLPTDIVEPVDLPDTPKEVKVEIGKGESSSTVSRRLELAGVIDSAKEFDAYMMQHGYDRKITDGEHTVNIGDSWMEIAKKLTKK